MILVRSFWQKLLSKPGDTWRDGDHASVALRRGVQQGIVDVEAVSVDAYDDDDVSEVDEAVERAVVFKHLLDCFR